MNQDHTREAALALLAENKVGALATLSKEGTPRVRPVHYANDGFTLYILSVSNTRKVKDLRANGAAAFVVTGHDRQHSLQIEGTAEEVTDTMPLTPVVSKLMSYLFPEGAPAAPVTHLDHAKPVLFKLTPSWVRFADFTKDPRENPYSVIEVHG